MVVSKRFALNAAEIKSVLRNALIFAGPAILVLLASFKDIIPQDSSNGILALYVLNVVLDAFRKFLQGRK